MGEAVEGYVGTGEDGTNIPPVVIGGVDADGNVQPLLVDADGTVQTATNTTPTLAAVVAVGNSVNNHKITNVTDPTGAQDAATKKYVDDAFTAYGVATEIPATPDPQDIADALLAAFPTVFTQAT